MFLVKTGKTVSGSLIAKVSQHVQCRAGSSCTGTGSKVRVCGAGYLGEALPGLRTNKPKCQLATKEFAAIYQQYVYKKQETKKLSVCLLVVIVLLFNKEVKY